MKLEYIIAAVVLLLLVEVTYLVVKSPRRRQLHGNGRPIFVDTSVLIDGRIRAIARSGFVGDTLTIPRSVIGELQFLADHADHDKRSRARFGLDVVSELQAMSEVTVEILQDGSKAEEGVDERLLKLAKQYNGAICTIDYNLGKVAIVEDIPVLSINELAQQLRMAYLPGEHLSVALVQKGQDSHQGVGYLSDGTMVVVEQAARDIGNVLEVECTRSLQTAAGKMIFARKLSSESKTNGGRATKSGGDTAGAKSQNKSQPTGKKSQRQSTKRRTTSEQADKRGSKRRSAADREAQLVNMINQ